jgi:hypothetical protein
MARSRGVPITWREPLESLTQQDRECAAGLVEHVVLWAKPEDISIAAARELAAVAGLLRARKEGA